MGVNTTQQRQYGTTRPTIFGWTPGGGAARSKVASGYSAVKNFSPVQKAYASPAPTTGLSNYQGSVNQSTSGGFSPLNYTPAFRPSNNYASTDPTLNQYAGNIGNNQNNNTYNPITGGSGGGGGGGGGGPTPTPQNQNQGYENIQNAQDSGNADIDADYNQSMSMLDNAQGGLQGQAGTANAQITNDASGVTTALGAQQATGEQGVQKSLSTAEASGKNALQQARDLFRQTQQSNTAQLSALGISSSSVSEALAERLGVETARRIAGVTGSLDEVRQNATNELGRIKNYAAEKATQLAENVRIQKDQIQQALVSGLNQINGARSQAASDKAQARSSLLNQVAAQIGALTQQREQFAHQLNVWSQQKAAALTPIIQDKDYFNTLQKTQNTLNQQFAPTGFNYTPNFNKDTQLSGWTTQKIPKVDKNGNVAEDDDFIRPNSY